MYRCILLPYVHSWGPELLACIGLILARLLYFTALDQIGDNREARRLSTFAWLEVKLIILFCHFPKAAVYLFGVFLFSFLYLKNICKPCGPGAPPYDYLKLYGVFLTTCLVWETAEERLDLKGLCLFQRVDALEDMLIQHTGSWEQATLSSE